MRGRGYAGFLTRKWSSRGSGQNRRPKRRPLAPFATNLDCRHYKYYMTALGKQVVALGLKLKELVIIPELAVATPR